MWSSHTTYEEHMVCASNQWLIGAHNKLAITYTMLPLQLTITLVCNYMNASIQLRMFLTLSYSNYSNTLQK